jgi:hypothetical protein
MLAIQHNVQLAPMVCCAIAQLPTALKDMQPVRGAQLAVLLAE